MVSLDAFINRIAKAAPTSADLLISLIAFLFSLKTPPLLVLDDAETFLDTVDDGSNFQARVAGAIDEISINLLAWLGLRNEWSILGLYQRWQAEKSVYWTSATLVAPKAWLY